MKALGVVWPRGNTWCGLSGPVKLARGMAILTAQPWWWTAARARRFIRGMSVQLGWSYCAALQRGQQPPASTLSFVLGLVRMLTPMLPTRKSAAWLVFWHFDPFCCYSRSTCLTKGAFSIWKTKRNICWEKTNLEAKWCTLYTVCVYACMWKESLYTYCEMGRVQVIFVKWRPSSHFSSNHLENISILFLINTSN